MKLILIGLNHRTAPVEIRERAAFPVDKIGEVSRSIVDSSLLREAVVVSTCNRVEIYGLASDARQSSAGIRQFVNKNHQLDQSIESHLYEYHDADCVRHLLEVVSGLDSMVLGETEILGQVKTAYVSAHTSGATGMALNRLFQKALSAAKQVRTKTSIARGSTSVGSVAVELAGKIFSDLSRHTVMIIGTGEMSESTARALKSRGVQQILVCSRTPDRGKALADELNGRAISFDDWPKEIEAVDIVISSTSAPRPIVTVDKLDPLMKLRKYKPLFLIDIAVPRDINRACGDLEGVYLYDIDDLQQIAQENVAARQRETELCQALITEHVSRFLTWFDLSRPALLQRHPEKRSNLVFSNQAHTQPV